MIHSMTGFASSEIDTGQGVLLWELRSVNHRYLEMHFKLPDGFRALEPALRDTIAARLRRGKVDANLQFRAPTEAANRLRLDDDIATHVIRQAQQLAEKIDSPAPFSALDVLRWPGVIAEDAIEVRSFYEPATKLLDTALDGLVANRSREGERIQGLLEERLVQINALALAVTKRMPVVLDNIRDRVRERALSLEIKVDAERLEQELVLLAQKMDVAEELDRLQGHVAEAHAAFAMTDAVGRRLDFLMQELNREANTTGSKSVSSEQTQASVEMKVLIEQMREQVQNIE